MIETILSSERGALTYKSESCEIGFSEGVTLVTVLEERPSSEGYRPSSRKEAALERETETVKCSG